MHFAAFEGPHAASDKSEFSDFMKRAEQGDPHADAALRLTVIQWLSCDVVIPDYVRRWLCDAVSKMQPSKPPNRPNEQLRKEAMCKWIDAALFMRDSARLSPEVNAWLSTQEGQPTDKTADEDIYRACGEKFGVAPKTCKNTYLNNRGDNKK